MSQRNPMNERYTTDKKRSGNTRRSAASAKPKSAAASTVTTGVKKKGKAAPKSNKREQRRRERDKAYAAERKYGDPPTKQFKRIRKIWIGFLVGAIVCVAISFAASKIDFFPEGSAMVFLIGAYACIIITLYLDFGKIRKMRREYAQRMDASQSKESRAEEKKRKAAARAARKEEEAKREAEEKEKAKMKSAPLKDKLKLFFTTRKR
ncbi:MAG: hypothetical protein Q4E88_06365 [Coriobacteriia bacterium]|nr:hypothetical protein [Coriobacteriia bacterium]